MTESNNSKVAFVYTLYSSLGDFIIIGDLAHKIEELSPQLKCIVIHSNNPVISQSKYPRRTEKFFNIFHPFEIMKLWTTIKRFHREGYTVMGLQQAPGSLRGFRFLKVLKLLRLINYIVDFNLYNADIITQPKGTYILDVHLNQVADILKINVPEPFYHLQLPVHYPSSKTDTDKIKIGIHPWTRREQYSCFVWPHNKWIETIKFLVSQNKYEIVLFGKNPKFNAFKDQIIKELGGDLAKGVSFAPSESIAELIQTINDCQMIVTVSTAVVHIGYALHKKMIILAGPNLQLWIPNGEDIVTIYDTKAQFPGGDKYIKDPRFPSVDRIEVNAVLSALKKLLPK